MYNWISSGVIILSRTLLTAIKVTSYLLSFYLPFSPKFRDISFFFFTGRQKYIRRTEKNRKEIYTVAPTSQEYTQYHLDTNFRLYLHRDTRKKERTTDLKVLFEASRTSARPSGVDLKERVGQICL